MSAFEQSLLSEMLPTSARNSAVSLISGTPSATVPIPMPRPSSLVPCPGSKLRWNLTASEILQTANDIMAKSKAVHDAVGALRPNQITYETVIKALAEDTASYYTARLPLHFVQHVFALKELKEASLQAERMLSHFDDELSMREDVFKVLLEAQKVFGDSLKPEAKRYLERLITFGKRNGLHLSKDIQTQITEILKQVNDLGIDFVKNLTLDNTVLKFTPKDLDGLPLDVMNTMKMTADGRCKVTLTGAHYLQCMKYVKNPDVRLKLETAFNSRCKTENTFILEKLIKLRHQKARLLSYHNHASYVLDTRMAKTPERVTAFLYDLQTKVAPLMEDDKKLFLQYKREDCLRNKREFDNKINLWDTRYYMTRVEEGKYAVDHNKLREYFPLHVVIHGLLEIYQELLGLKFELIVGADIWHPSVTFYSTKDKTTDTLIGYFYLDLAPRSGKFGQAACFCLQPACYLANGTRQIGIAALVANFTPPVGDKPPLLTHEEVETFFHEFGHVMHQICSETEFVLFSGANVEKDFVEAPSQMLENWVWERESLARMSAHYKDGSAIPTELMTALVNSRRANGGMLCMWQILLSKFDQAIHSSAEVNTIALFEEMSKKIIGIAPIDGTSTPATFSHMACGFDGQYYAYLWSEVYSADMFFRCKKDGLRNPKVGLDYRSMILKPGGSMDADHMIRGFLGRDLNPGAFFTVKGLTA